MLIQIEKETSEKLKSMKKYDRESYEEVINRIINYYNENKE